MPEYVTERVMIWGKTYPELSKKYVETVCTGAIREDGTPVRLYPVPLRYLEHGHEYQLYDWVDVPMTKSTSDPRPESFKVYAEKIRFVERIDTDGGTWRRRASTMFQRPEWQFGSVEALKRAQQESGRSIGVVDVRDITGVSLVRKPPDSLTEFQEQLKAVRRQPDMFRPEYLKLDFLPYDLKLSWRCRDECSECAKSPHEMKALDWGLLELARRDGWEKAKARLEAICNLSQYDFRLFMGNFRNRPWVFGVIGLWYPKKRPQYDMLDSNLP